MSDYMRRKPGLLAMAGLSILLFSNGVLATPVLASNHIVTIESQVTFSDVNEGHYAKDAIVWAQSKGIVNGYGDGRFGPNAKVTEGQYAKMLTQYFQLADSERQLIKKTTNAVWSDEFYNKLAAYGVPLNGYLDNQVRNNSVKRGVVAQSLAYLGGYRMNLDESIEFLMENQISTGQQTGSSADLSVVFGANNDLTRAQVVTFLYRMEQNNFSAIGTSARSTYNATHERDLNEWAEVSRKGLDEKYQIETKHTGSQSGVLTGGFHGPTLTEDELMMRKPVANGKNKVTARFEGKVPADTVPYAFEQQRFSIMDNKSNRQIFSYMIANPEYNLGHKGEGTYSTENILVDVLYFKDHNETIADLVVSSGYKLSKKEVIDNLEKARKMGIHDDSILYKGYRFYKLGDSFWIQKTY